MGNDNNYRYSLSLTSQFCFCGIPFRLDTSPNCFFKCSYCFSNDFKGRHVSRNNILDVDRFRNYLGKVFAKKITGLKSELLLRRMPIHFGGVSDPFSNPKISRKSREVLSVLADYNYPVLLSTKNATELIKPEMISVLKRNKKVGVQISIPSPKEEFCSIIEPRVPSPKKRIRCIEELSKEGVHCICRIQPLFVPEISIVEKKLIPMLAKAKCKHVVVEHLKLPIRKGRAPLDRALKEIGWDAYDYYKSNGGISVAREWLLPSEVKLNNLQSLVASIRKHGMTYGAADYGLNHLGDTGCCCGIDALPGFNFWLRGNIPYVIKKSRTGMIRFAELEKKWHPDSSIKMVINSHCRSVFERCDMLNYLKNKWNNPGTVNAPDSFWGIVWEGDYDDQGNCIYIKKKV
jgi:DNA repair photolyase